MTKLTVLFVMAMLFAACSHQPPAPPTTVLNQPIMSQEIREMLQGVRLAIAIEPRLESLEKLLTVDPQREVKAQGDIPCDRHDGITWVIVGGEQRDVVKCSWGSEIVITKGGNDEIDSGWGVDALHGGAGDDVLDGSNGDVILYGGPGNDIITGSWGNKVINGGPGDDQIEARGGNIVMLVGNNWGHDVIKNSCTNGALTLLFSNEINEADVRWVGKKLTDTRTGSTLEFAGATSCLQMIYSEEKFN